jgi:hypothetical protein
MKNDKLEGWLVVASAIAVILALLWVTGAFGKEWQDDPSITPAVHHWFQNLMQPDNPQVSCCGEADAFEADDFETTVDEHGETIYVAIITNGKGAIPEGTRIPIPNSKIKWDDPNPTGHGIIFISTTGTVYCYCPPAGI